MAIVGATMQIAFWTIVLPTAIWALIKLFGDFFYGIGVMLFRVMDLLQSVFRKLAGLGTVYVDGEAVEGDILSYIMKSNAVVDVLISVTVFALGLVILGSIVQMIRLEYTTEGSKNSKDKIFTTALKSLLMFVLIPIVCFVGIRLSNYLLQAVDYATSASGASTVSGSVFMASAAEASKVVDEKNITKTADLEDLLASLFQNQSWSNAVVKKDGSNAYIDHFKNVFSVSDTGSGNEVSDKAREKLAKLVEQRFIVAKETEGGSFEIGTLVSDLGEEAYTGTNLERWDRISYLNVDTVSYFYSTANINYLLLFLGCYISIKALFSAAMGMIARLYKVVALFVIAPAAIGLQPIDEGSAYKSWRKSFIQNVLSCYGFVVALNLYFMVVGVLQTIELWDGVGAWLPNKFVQFLFVLTGATMIKDLSGMFSGLIGAADAMADGEKVTGEVGKMAGSVAKVGMGAASLGAGAFKGMAGFAAKHAPRRVVGEDGKKTWGKSVAAVQKDINKANKAEAKAESAKSKFDSKFIKNADGSYSDKDTGHKITDDKLINKAKKMDRKASTALFAANDETLQDNKTKAEELMRTDAGLARRSAFSTGMSVSAGQNFNRFTSMVKGSGLASTFNNLTGNIGSYISGKAYKGDDEEYQKDMKERGVDVDTYAPKAGTTVYSRYSDKAKGAIVSAAPGLDRAENAKITGTAAKTYTEQQSFVKQQEQVLAEVKDQKDKDVAELTSKGESIQTKIDGMEHDHSKIGDTWSYTKVDMSEMNKFMEEQYKTFTSGGMGVSAFKKALESVYDSSTGTARGSLEGYAGNSAIQDMLQEMSTAVSHYNPSSGYGTKGVRDEMLRSANLNIDSAEIEANAHDAVNNKADYGSFKERKEYKDALGAREATQTAIKDKEDAYAELAAKHEQLVREGKTAADYTEEMSMMEQAFKKANDRLAQKLQNEGIKAQFGTDQQFKINDKPMLEALKRVQQSIKEAADKANSGKTDKLLEKLIEETKKKK